MPDEPMPVKGKCPVMEYSYTEFGTAHAEQAEKGIRKYGTTLQTCNGRRWYRDARAELVDALAYISQGELELKQLVKLCCNLADANRSGDDTAQHKIIEEIRQLLYSMNATGEDHE